MSIREERNIQKLIRHIDDRVFELEKIAKEGKHSRTISDALLDAAKSLDEATKKIQTLRKKRGMPIKHGSSLQLKKTYEAGRQELAVQAAVCCR